LAETLEIPIFPLQSVLFPGGRLSLRVFEPRYVDMTRACLRDDSVFGVCLIRAGFEVGRPAVPCDIGCTARILECDVPSPGLFTLVTEGEQRFRIIDRHARADGLIMARVELLPVAGPMPLAPGQQMLSRLLDRIMGEFGAVRFSPPQLDDASWVGRRLVELLPLMPEKRQLLLEADDPAQMLAVVQEVVDHIGDDPDDDEL